MNATNIIVLIGFIIMILLFILTRPIQNRLIRKWLDAEKTKKEKE